MILGEVLNTWERWKKRVREDVFLASLHIQICMSCAYEMSIFCIANYLVLFSLILILFSEVAMQYFIHNLTY